MVEQLDCDRLVSTYVKMLVITEIESIPGTKFVEQDVMSNDYKVILLEIFRLRLKEWMSE